MIILPLSFIDTSFIIVKLSPSISHAILLLAFIPASIVLFLNNDSFCLLVLFSLIGILILIDFLDR